MSFSPAATPVQPANASQTVAVRKIFQDNVDAAARRMALAFAPHEGRGQVGEFLPADVNTGADTITVTGNVYADQQAIKTFSSGVVPAGLTSGVTVYVKGTGDTFQLSATPGGAAIVLTDTGTGFHRLEPQPEMYVTLEPGWVLNGIALTEKVAQITAQFTAPAPAADPRIDRVVVAKTTGVLSVIPGAPAPSPSAPAITTGNLPVCQVALTNATTEITNQDITDERGLWEANPISATEKGAANGVAPLDGSGLVDVSDLPMSVASGVAGLDANANMDESIAAGGTVGLQLKLVEIGDWDMDADVTATVTHGLTLTKIRGIVAIMIRSDDDTTYVPVPALSGASGTPNIWPSTIVGATVSLVRLTGGTYDSTSYDSTGFNRGWVTFLYEP